MQAPDRFFFFFNDTATTEIYTLSLHDALPILDLPRVAVLHTWRYTQDDGWTRYTLDRMGMPYTYRSEEHTSELQSRQYLVCRLLLEKKKTKIQSHQPDLNTRTACCDHRRHWYL